MNKSLLLAVLTTLLLSTPLAGADETHHTDTDKAPTAAMTDQGIQQMGKVQERMFLMHKHMLKVMDAKNPQDRERLMQEHSKMMQHGMSGEQDTITGHEMMGGDAQDGKMSEATKDL